MILPVSGNQINFRRGQSLKSSALYSKINNAYKNIDIDSADYIKYAYKLVKSWCRQVVEINTEKGAIQNIVQSKEPHIFIMNHTMKQSKDINAAKFFNTLLYREYIYQDNAANCPRSKVLASKGVLSGMSDKGERLKWLGVVPINTMGSKGKSENSVILKNLIEQIAKGKINLFVFPEGVLAALTFLPTKYKFQPGAAAIVKKVLELRDKIKVVPLGFAHNREESAIHIGEPVCFRKDGEKYIVSRGNADSDCFDKNLKEFYSDKEEAVLTAGGIPVGRNNVVPYISGVLMKNMECCAREAKRDLFKPDDGILVL